MDELKLTGVVLNKRKQRSSTTCCIKAHIKSISHSDQSSCEERYQQLAYLECGEDTVLLPSGVSVDIMNYVTCDSVIEVTGRVHVENDESDGLKVELYTLTVLRIAPKPAQIKQLLAAESSLSSNDELTRRFFSDILSVEKEAVTRTGNSTDVLSMLQSGKLKVKDHIHTMTNRVNTAPPPRCKRVPPEERALVKWAEDVATDMYKQIPKASIEINCTDSEEPSCVRSCSGSNDCAINLPVGVADCPSRTGPLTRLEYIHGKKEPQTQWIVSRLLALMGGDLRNVHILDVGGGRGDLAVAIALQMHAQGADTSSITIVDVNSRSLQDGRGYAERRGVERHTEFIEGDVRDYMAQYRVVEGVREVVVGLHACGDLSDLAIEYAAKIRAGFIVVPCCFSKCFRPSETAGWLQQLRWHSCQLQSPVPIAQNADGEDGNWLQARSLLGKIAESQPRDLSWKCMQIINMLRLIHILSVTEKSCTWELSLEAFSRSFSMRNMVVCGKYTCNAEIF